MTGSVACRVLTPDELIDIYCRAWSSPDPSERAAILARIWEDGATYVDPRVYVSGAFELMEYIEKVQAHRPGAQVLRTSRVDVHHHVGRFTWHVQLADGSTLPEGIDFVELSADGSKIVRVAGFFGAL